MADNKEPGALSSVFSGAARYITRDSEHRREVQQVFDEHIKPLVDALKSLPEKDEMKFSIENYVLRTPAGNTPEALERVKNNLLHINYGSSNFTFDIKGKDSFCVYYKIEGEAYVEHADRDDNWQKTRYSAHEALAKAGEWLAQVAPHRLPELAAATGSNFSSEYQVQKWPEQSAKKPEVPKPRGLNW